ncbi:Hypothetical predicted protein, partial [Mytilus galloprovincialis]
LQQIADEKGPAEVKNYLKENLKKWKKEEIYFAVTGRSATGKSTFINKIRDVKPREPGFAKAGSGNTTKEPTPYPNPKNERIVYYDLPGVGTLEFEKALFPEKMKLEIKLSELKKSYCLVRSKIDEDLANAEHDGRDERDVIPEIRKQIQDDLSRQESLKNCDEVFLISSRRKDVGEWQELLAHIEKSLPPIKFETFMYSLPTLTEKIIDVKYKTLKTRIKIATGSAAVIAAIPVPGVDVAVNMGILVEEIYHYNWVFGLGKERLAALKGFDRSTLNCNEFHVPAGDIVQLIVTQLGKLMLILEVESVADILSPIIGSIISAGTSAVITYRYLSQILEKFRDDARTVYRYVIKEQGV